MASKISNVVALAFVFICFPSAQPLFHFDHPAVFNFGDSNSDAGNLVYSGIEDLNLPNGEVFFHTPSGRYSDGRLIVDFLMEAMNLPLLNAYLDSIGLPSFRTGCDFAVAAATLLPATQASYCPFSLGIQVNQFFRFKTRVLDLLSKGTKLANFLPEQDFFEKALYMFDVGQNDLSVAFYMKPFDQILPWIPSVLTEFETQFQRLYDQGARKFWIHNTGPLGCLTQNVLRFGTDPSKLDQFGCVINHNRVARIFNVQLHALCKKLQGHYPFARITCVDIFTIKYDLIANYTRYGFEQPIRACCGYGGPPLNYDFRLRCGSTKILNGTSATSKGCGDSAKYINWDGIHYTEAANRHVSSQILTGKFSDPPFWGQNAFPSQD